MTTIHRWRTYFYDLFSIAIFLQSVPKRNYLTRPIIYNVLRTSHTSETQLFLWLILSSVDVPCERIALSSVDLLSTVIVLRRVSDHLYWQSSRLSECDPGPRSEDDRFPHVLSSFPSDFPFAHVFLLVFAASFIHLIPNPQHNSLFNHSISFFVLVRLLLLLSPCVFPSSLCLCFNIVYHNSVPSFLCLSAHALRPPARVVNFSFSALVISSAAVWLLFLVSNK